MPRFEHPAMHAINREKERRDIVWVVVGVCAVPFGWPNNLFRLQCTDFSAVPPTPISARLGVPFEGRRLAIIRRIYLKEV